MNIYFQCKLGTRNVWEVLILKTTHYFFDIQIELNFVYFCLLNSATVNTTLKKKITLQTQTPTPLTMNATSKTGIRHRVF